MGATQSIGTINVAPTTMALGGSITASATASSGLPVVFSSATPSVCSVSGSAVTSLTAGTCTIAADQAGNSAYQAATQATRSIAIAKVNQSLGAIGFSPGTLVAGGATTASASASSGLAASYSSVTPAVCTVSGNSVTGVAIGTCTIAANQAGDANYNAATQGTQNITVGKGGQTLSFGAVPVIALGGANTVSVSATSGLAVSLSSLTPAVCTVSGSNVSGIALGTCIVAANQAGDTSYNAATQATQSIAIGNKVNQSLSFGSAPAVVIGGAGAVSASATSGLAVSLSSTTPSICSVSGNTVTGVAAGACIVAANQAGNANYNAATQVTQSFTIGKLSQSVNFVTVSALIVGASGAISATATSGLGASFTSVTASICTVSGNTVTAIAAGSCTIAVDQAGNATYNPAAQVTRSITVGKISQTLGFGAAPTLVVGGTGAVSATATSALAVSFSSATTGVCTVSGSTVTGTAVGSCTIVATQAGNASYNAAAQVTQSITVSKVSQSVSFGSAPALVMGGTGAVSATATSALAVSFSSTTPSVCSVTGSTVTGVGAGICNVAANQAGNATYSAAAQAMQSITVGKASQSVSFGTAPALVVGGTGAVSATATSALAVSFSSTTPSVCSVSGSTVTGIAGGSCVIAANQAGNANYDAAAQQTQSITVATVPAVTLSPTSLSFLSTQLGTSSAAQSITLTNSGSATLNIGGIAISGDYAKTTTCGATLAVGASCAIAVTFTPTVSGARSGVMTVTSDAPGSSHSVSLSGSGGVATGATVTFGGIVVDQSQQPISGAVVKLTASGKDYSGATDTSGHFSISFNKTGLPTMMAILVTKAGYAPLAIGLNIATLSSFYLGTLKMEPLGPALVVLDLEPGLHHLGDGQFGGAVNSQFQMSVEGTDYSKAFILSAEQMTATGATMTLLIKGVDAICGNNSPIRINGSIVAYLQSSPADGSFGSATIAIPMRAFSLGANTFGIESKFCSTDLDDFEFTNVVLRLSGMTAVVVAATTTATATTTTVATTSTTSQTTAGAPSFELGWNLAGNGSDAPINVASTFADATRFTTVWKWIAAQSAWAFYAPSLATQGGTALADYVASKGYQLLSTIAGGEGFWVNAKSASSAQPPAGNSIGTSYFQVQANPANNKLVAGWNLAATGDDIAPGTFATYVGNITTLWAWDAANGAWYFHAPALAANNTLASYIQGKGYKDFGTRTLGKGLGFWVNYAGAPASTGGGVPTVSGVSPATGAAGASVVVTGTNFSATPASNTVKFNGIQATVTAASVTSLTVTVPGGASTGAVSVATAAGNGASAASFTVSTGGGATPGVLFACNIPSVFICQDYFVGTTADCGTNSITQVTASCSTANKVGTCTSAGFFTTHFYVGYPVATAKEVCAGQPSGVWSN